MHLLAKTAFAITTSLAGTVTAVKAGGCGDHLSDLTV
jgi:hypothetical protein